MATAPPSTTSPQGATGAAETSSATRRPAGTAPPALAPRTARGRSRPSSSSGWGLADGPPPAYLPRAQGSVDEHERGGRVSAPSGIQRARGEALEVDRTTLAQA